MRALSTRSARLVRPALFVVGCAPALLWGYAQHAQRPAAPETAHARIRVQQALLASVPEAPGAGPVERELVLLGELMRLRVDDEPGRASAALERVVSRLERLARAVDPQQPDGELARLNASAGRDPVPLSEDTRALLSAARELARLRTPQTATALELDARGGRLTAADAHLDPSELFGAYAAQLALATLHEAGLPRAAVHVGDDVYAARAARQGPWPATLTHPRWQQRVLSRFGLEQRALAVAHCPRTRDAAGSREQQADAPGCGALSAAVLADGPVRAKSLAATLLALGPARGMAWIAGLPDTQALLIEHGGQLHRTPGWPGGAAEEAPAPAAVRDIEVRAGVLVSVAPDGPVHDLGAPDERTRSAPPAPLTAATEARLRGGPMLRVSSNHPREPSFSIDRSEVSNAQYRAFLEQTRADPHRHCHPDEPAHKDHTPRYFRDDFRPGLLARGSSAALAPFTAETFRRPDYPVVGVDYWDAFAYARWAGKQLPTRAQWQRAACGGSAQRWPWGDHFAVGRANLGGEMNGEHDGHTYAAPVVSFRSGAAPCGALHMAGNVEEWTEEGFVAGGSSSSAPSQAECQSGRLREPDYRAFNLGFRTVKVSR